MSISNIKNEVSSYNSYSSSETKELKQEKIADTLGIPKDNKDYGKIIGEPRLSQKSQKYYDSLKKQFSDMDFILVSKDQKENVKSRAANYASPGKTVVLIDEDTVERMAEDESYRKKFEGIIANARNSIAGLKEKVEPYANNIQGFGMEIDSDGQVSFFAVLKKFSEKQKESIEKRREAIKEEKTAEAKEVRKEAERERLDRARSRSKDSKDSEITLRANSIEELLSKINEAWQNDRINFIRTDEEKLLGGQIDFRG